MNKKKKAGAGRAKNTSRKRWRLPLAVCALLCAAAAALFCADIYRHSGREEARPAFQEIEEENAAATEDAGGGAIPQSLQSLKERYPECAAFVDAYPENKDRTHTIDLSGEVTKGEIPLFLQWDERWGYETYGDDFLAVTACGPTALSMVVCGLTGETVWDPLAVARFAEERGYYIEGEGSSWSLMTEGASALGLAAEGSDADEIFLLKSLKEGRPVICSMYPGDFTDNGHFIVLTGVDGQGRIVLNDSNSRVRSEKHWELDTLLPQIRAMWAYRLADTEVSVGVGG